MIRRFVSDPSDLLTKFGVFLVLTSVLYFGREAIFNLSPVVKSFLLVISSFLFLIISVKLRETRLKSSLYLLSSISYLTFLGYFIFRLSPSSETVFGLLGISGAIFVLIGLKIDEIEINDKNLKIIGLLAALVCLLVVGYDLSSPDVQYEVEVSDSEIILGEEETNVLNVSVVNEYSLPKVYDIERFEACSSDRLRFAISPEDGDKTSGIIEGRNELIVKYEMRREILREDMESTESFELRFVENCPADNDQNNTLLITQNRVS